MPTGLSRLNYIAPVDLQNSTVLVRLVVNKDNNPSADTPDTNTTHLELSLAQLSNLIVASNPAIAALVAGTATTNQIVTALQTKQA